MYWCGQLLRHICVTWGGSGGGDGSGGGAPPPALFVWARPLSLPAFPHYRTPRALAQAGISSVPTFKAYSSGKVVNSFTGAARASLDDMVEALKLT